MAALVIIILALGTIVALASKLTGKGHDTPIVEKQTCSTCNGDNAKCEQDCMMEAATQPIEYFEDEELDAFRGRPSDSYTDDEVEMFADTLYTMRHDEVAAWCRSLNLRGIQLPDELKDEVVMLVSE